MKVNYREQKLKCCQTCKYACQSSDIDYSCGYNLPPPSGDYWQDWKRRTEFTVIWNGICDDYEEMTES